MIKRTTDVSPADAEAIITTLSTMYDVVQDQLTTEACRQKLQQGLLDLMHGGALPVAAVIAWARAKMPAADTAVRRYAYERWHNREALPPEGDVVALVQHLDGVDFREAVATLTGDRIERPQTKGGNGAAHSTPVADFTYTDENGQPHIKVVRLEPGKDGRRKDFKQLRPDGDSGWIATVKGVRPIPFRLPELIEAIATERPVYIVEGEGKAEAMRAHGFIATTNAGGQLETRAERILSRRERGDHR